MMMPELDNGFGWRGLGQVAVLGAAVSYSFAGIFGKRFKLIPAVVNSAGMGCIFLGLIVIDGRALKWLQPIHRPTENKKRKEVAS